MNVIDTLTLLAILVALAALPSASVALVIARSATLGPAHGIAVGIGIILGDLLFVAVAIAGVSVAAQALGGFFAVVKIAGGLYLVWLGIGLLRSHGAPLEPPPHAQGSKGLLASTIAGFVLTLGDIKAILFYASLFPVFVDLATIDTVDIAVIIAITVVGVGGVKIAYAWVGSRLARLARRHHVIGPYRKALGSVMIGAGGYLVFKA